MTKELETVWVVLEAYYAIFTDADHFPAVLWERFSRASRGVK